MIGFRINKHGQLRVVVNIYEKGQMRYFLTFQGFFASMDMHQTAHLYAIKFTGNGCKVMVLLDIPTDFILRLDNKEVFVNFRV